MSLAFTIPRPRSCRQRGRSCAASSRRRAERKLLELVHTGTVGRDAGKGVQAGRDVDWDYLVGLAYREGLAPQVYDTLEGSPLGEAEEVPLSKFRYLYHLGCRQNARACAQLEEVLDGFRSEGLEAIVLKGAALAGQVYPDPALRPFMDIDLMVRRQDLGRAHRLLQRMGYGFNYKGQAIAPPSDADVKYRSARQYFRRHKGYLSVDLYWQLSRYPYLTPMDYEGLWQPARRVDLAGGPTLVLSPEDAVLHHSLDFTLGVWYGHPEVRNLRDIAQITHQQEVDWEALAFRASRSALGAPLYFSCRLAEKMLGAKLPGEIIEGMYPGAGRWKSWAMRRLEENIFGGAHPVKYSFVAVLMRLAGPERGGDKAIWLARLLVPPRGLWGGVFRGLGRLLRRSGPPPARAQGV